MKYHAMTQKQTPKIQTKLSEMQISFHSKNIAGLMLVLGIIAFFI